MLPEKQLISPSTPIKVKEEMKKKTLLCSADLISSLEQRYSADPCQVLTFVAISSSSFHVFPIFLMSVSNSLLHMLLGLHQLFCLLGSRERTDYHGLPLNAPQNSNLLGLILTRCLGYFDCCPSTSKILEVVNLIRRMLPLLLLLSIDVS